MKCQKCSSSTQVLETRIAYGLIKRRRKCLSCGDRATTEERWADSPPPAQQPKPVPALKATTKSPVKDSTRRQRLVEARRRVEDMSYFSEDNDYLSGIKGL